MSRSKSTKQAKAVLRKSKATAGRRLSTASKRCRRGDYESHMVLKKEYDEACEELRNDPTLTVSGVARARGLNRSTLRRRHLGLSRVRAFDSDGQPCLTHISQAPHDAHVAQQILTPAQEAALVAWTIKRGREGRPVTQIGLRAQVKELTGTRPSRGWTYAFEVRNPRLVFSTPRSLDPRRAACFNPTAIAAHFDALAAALRMGLTPRHIYNMDEQGIQFGGSRNRSGKRYFFGSGSGTRYRLRSDNLELVTVIDTVCADGSKLEPAFVFQGTHNYEAGWMIEDRPFVTCVLLLHIDPPCTHSIMQCFYLGERVDVRDDWPQLAHQVLHPAGSHTRARHHRAHPAHSRRTRLP
jgi:hypothetical protein